jgi:hypothetical protein
MTRPKSGEPTMKRWPLLTVAIVSFALSQLSAAAAWGEGDLSALAKEAWSRL